ncbi:MAG: hypothetical protein K6T78_02220 [Alicyclobacillus sp.]|nr:hypothetical protein [Alicyclobacillus sp.]
MGVHMWSEIERHIEALTRPRAEVPSRPLRVAPPRTFTLFPLQGESGLLSDPPPRAPAEASGTSLNASDTGRHLPVSGSEMDGVGRDNGDDARRTRAAWSLQDHAGTGSVGARAESDVGTRLAPGARIFVPDAREQRAVATPPVGERVTPAPSPALREIRRLMMQVSLADLEQLLQDVRAAIALVRGEEAPVPPAPTERMAGPGDVPVVVDGQDEVAAASRTAASEQGQARPATSPGVASAPVQQASWPRGDASEVDRMKYRYIVGKRAGKDLLDARGNLLLRRGDVITESAIGMAEREGKLVDLIVNMVLDEADV